MERNAAAFDFLFGEWDIAMLDMPEGSTAGLERRLGRVPWKRCREQPPRQVV